MEESCLVYIEDMLSLSGPDESLESILKLTNLEYKVPVRTLRNWWKHFLLWGEYPFETRERAKKFRKIKRRFRRTSLITEELVQCVKEIVDEHPEFYLDEIQMSICTRLQVYLLVSILWKVLSEKINYSMQICYESAAQRNENDRGMYKNALECLVSNPDQVIFVDETHKDKNASRRRKAWGPRNSGGIALRRWFKNTIRYTMIAALDINGFIPSTIETVRRDEISSEGAAGTVDATHFEKWVEHYLCPTLGRYDRGEPRSIVVMDNASTHMDSKVSHMIRATGAYLLYTAPYSPDLNPIELAFNIYKAHLKRHNIGFEFDWYGTHLNALEGVDRDICIMEFRRCGVPMSHEVMTSAECEEIAIALIANEIL